MQAVDDIALVQRCLEGEQAAFEELIEKYQNIVFNVAFRMVQCREDAEDIVQSVFLSAYENLPRFNSRYKFFSWIYRMTMNESINLIHRRKPEVMIDDYHATTGVTPESDCEVTEVRTVLERAVAALTPEYRAVIILRHFEELTYEEIAEALKLPMKTVKSRIYSARQLLAQNVTLKAVMSHD